MTAGGNSFKNATAHKVNSYYTLAISYCTFCVGKHTILGPANLSVIAITTRNIYESRFDVSPTLVTVYKINKKSDQKIAV